jgi:hypothetical protein
MAKIYHQCGHNYNWNLDSFGSGVGSGLILSPVNQKFSNVGALDATLKAKCLFDPQFYLPSSQKKNFLDYPFFPETISGLDGFSTIDFSQLAEESASLCLDFQLTNNFESVVIPARFFYQMITDWVEQQELFLRPFLGQIEKRKITKTVMQTLPITQHMVNDVGFRAKILNWITSFPRVDGIYLLVNVIEDSKQLLDGNYLFNLMTFIQSCKNANLKVLVGYTNAEALCLSLIDGVDFTIGAFENTRKFSDERFVKYEEEEKRGPKARIYMPGLLTWIQFNHAKEIKDSTSAIWNNIHVSTKYSEEAFALPKEPTFNQPQLYKHYFSVFTQQFNELSSLELKNRYTKLRDTLKRAQDSYVEIENLPVDLDRHAKGQHIDSWLNCINKFYREFIK